MAVHQKAGNLGSNLLQQPPKPLRTERVRLKLPISVKSPRASGAAADQSLLGGQPGNDKQSFLEQLDMLTKAGPKYKIRLDPLKALEPDRKKLTSLEAQRIISVLEELKLKSEVIIVLPHVVKDLAKYREILGEHIYEILKGHQKFLEQFRITEKVYSEMTSKHTSSDEAIENTLHKLNNMRIELEFSIRNILRAFRNQEDRMRTLLAEVSTGKTREGSYFVQSVSDLKDILFDRLLVSPGEQHDKMQFLAQISAQDRHNQLVIERLEAEVDLAVEERDEEIKIKNQVIHQIQINLQTLEKATEEDLRRAKTEAEKQTQSDAKASDAKKHKLNTELKLLVNTLASTTDENRDEEQGLRKRKWKVESEIENWIQKYDEEMMDKQEEYEQIDDVYQEEKKQLAELEFRFKKLETEYKGIMDKRQTIKDQAVLEKRRDESRTHGATVIQSVWRAYRVRKQIRIKEKLRGKKNKKKGKGKKKKIY